MPRSRSIVRIASTSRPENCAGWVTASHGASVAPERLAAELASAASCGRGSGARRRAAAEAVVGRSAAARRRPPAARRRRSGARRRSGPATSIVRMTFGAAETSISVTIVVLCSGASVGATGRPIGSCADAPLVAIASTRSPRSSSRWSKPSSLSVPVTAPPGSIDAQRAVGDGDDPATVGLDHVGLVDADLLRVRARELGHGLGAPLGGHRRAASIASVCGTIRGVAMLSAGGATARPTTPTPPRVRCAPSRA